MDVYKILDMMIDRIARLEKLAYEKIQGNEGTDNEYTFSEDSRNRMKLEIKALQETMEILENRMVEYNL
jgi:hypothetical protein